MSQPDPGSGSSAVTMLEGSRQGMSANEYVLPLADARTAQLAVAGGKGASLARLSAAGLPVPGGFVIATAAYQQFMQDNELEPRLVWQSRRSPGQDGC